MEYKTPGVYIREVDSGPKPIESVSTAIPGFLGLFPYNPPADAMAISGTDGNRAIEGKIPPQLVDSSGKISANHSTEAAASIIEAFRFRDRQVKDVGALLNLYGHNVKIEPGSKGRVKISDTKDPKTKIEIADVLVDVKGAVITEDDEAVEQLLNDIGQVFALEQAKPKHAKDVLSAYGLNFEGSAPTALNSEYSIPPIAVTNKSEFFRWLQSFFAEYLLATEPMEDLLPGQSFEDPDDAADAVFESLARDPALKKRFQDFLSQPSVFNFVASVNGFYDNGGGKAYVYLMGTSDMDCPIRENQADKLGIYAFDDVDDMALMAAPGLTPRQQKEMLEYCEIRKDRFALLDGPIVSDGQMDIPASEKGYGAIYVPWVKVAKPTWFNGKQDHIKVTGPNRRKLIKTEKNELFVPPSGHIAGIIARVDGERGVHKAPANELIMGITGLSQNINRIEQGQYNERGINVVRVFKDRGIRVWGARTLATKSDPSWKYINVRRLFIMVEQSILLGAQWAVFEPNDQTLWKKLVRDVRAYLLRVWRSGALFGNTPEEAFYVRCDEETNPRYLIDAGQVNVQIGICPVKPAEFVIFNIGQWDGGALIEE
ncbi:MAG: phage tail sheath C-terminal domain-containing protein [Myxococcota bacterium]|nr:phage tail sheath C-terminal domain-containing protein [Myxococcota bacterium]